MKRLTAGFVSYNIAEPIDPKTLETPGFGRSYTFQRKAEEAAAAEKSTS
ncbi:MAG: hypothetical protein VW268_05850 [Rhodospirillaceae bacterium]